ncbi:MAG: hypothetical protein WCY56_04155, partial [Aminobacteriaceae bacterium]
ICFSFLCQCIPSQMIKNPTIERTNGKTVLSLNTFHVKIPEIPCGPEAAEDSEGSSGEEGA